MSKLYASLYGEKKSVTSPEMRAMSTRPGAQDEKGKPIYFTEQHHKKECDINHIINKYDKTGLISHVQKIEARYGDVTGIEFRAAIEMTLNAQKMFDSLPSKIRNRFRNDPGEFLDFFENPENRDEAIKLGLISNITPPEKDGLGEHVKPPEDE